jgi:LysM repeat protein
VRVSSYFHWRWRAATSAVIGASVLAIAACGSDDNPSTKVTTTTAPLVTTTTLPPETTTTVPTEYIVQKGDSLGKIAKKFNVTVADLVVLNAIANPDKISEGQRLKIPPPAGAATTVAPPPATTTAPAPATTTG